MTKLLQEFRAEDNGASMVEYALLVLLIATGGHGTLWLILRNCLKRGAVMTVLKMWFRRPIAPGSSWANLPNVSPVRRPKEG